MLLNLSSATLGSSPLSLSVGEEVSTSLSAETGSGSDATSSDEEDDDDEDDDSKKGGSLGWKIQWYRMESRGTCILNSNA